jgi:hypothetical protein
MKLFPIVKETRTTTCAKVAQCAVLSRFFVAAQRKHRPFGTNIAVMPQHAIRFMKPVSIITTGVSLSFPE